MRPLSPSVKYLVIAIVAIYSLGMLFSTLISPPRNAIVDTFGEHFNVFGRNAGLVVRGQRAYNRGGKQVIIVGASNVQEGLRPNLITKRLSDYRVHNLSIGASNITQARQVVDLVLDSLPESSYEDTIFVTGIVYTHFVTNAQRWKGGNTTIEDEMLRYGLYRRADDGRFEPAFRPIRTSTLILMLQPFLAADAIIYGSFVKSARGAAVFARNRWVRNLPAKNSENLDEVEVDEEYKDFRIKFWLDYMGTEDGDISNEQFDELNTLATAVTENGSKMLIVELPIPQWHKDRAPHYQSYLQSKSRIRSALAVMENVHFLDLEHLDSDDDFYDSVHPRPRVRPTWSRLIADELIEIAVPTE